MNWRLSIKKGIKSDSEIHEKGTKTDINNFRKDIKSYSKNIKKGIKSDITSAIKNRNYIITESPDFIKSVRFVTHLPPVIVLRTCRIS